MAPPSQELEPPANPGRFMIERIKSVGKRELKQEARIAMRTIDAVWAGTEVADGDLKRMADAVERIAGCKQKGEDERVAAVAWLKARRDEVGLTALAKVLLVDAANLGKVIEETRNPPKTLLTGINAHIRKGCNGT
jgi:hypothetical protein